MMNMGTFDVILTFILVLCACILFAYIGSSVSLLQLIINLEFFSIMNILTVSYILSHTGSMFVSFIFLVVVVCESAVSLVLLVNMSRMFSNELMASTAL